MAHEAGKGSSPRPISVEADTFASNWERTFGKKEVDKKQSDEKTDKDQENNTENKK